MKVYIHHNPKELGISAGLRAAELIKKTIQDKGFANIILATGTSQFETIQQLIRDSEIAWDRVQMFHLDEYIGLPITHQASFRRYLNERFISLVPNLKIGHLINGELDPEEECNRLGELILQNPIDVALVGIGENGHLAFNDPPANFDTEKPWPQNYNIINFNKFNCQGNINTSKYENNWPGEDFYIYENNCFIVGTLFGGGKEICIKIADLVRDKFEYFLSKQIVNNEQIILGILYQENKDNFSVITYLNGHHLPFFSILG